MARESFAQWLLDSYHAELAANRRCLRIAALASTQEAACIAAANALDEARHALLDTYLLT